MRHQVGNCSAAATRASLPGVTSSQHLGWLPGTVDTVYVGEERRVQSLPGGHSEALAWPALQATVRAGWALASSK